MRILGDRRAAVRQAARLTAAARTLRTVAALTAAIAVVGWLWLIWRSVVTPATWPAAMVGVVGMISLAAVLLPRWGDQLRDQALAAGQRVNGAQRFEATLADLLDADWTLLLNAAPTDGDALLIGPHGIFALLLLASDVTQRNAGSEWQQRTAAGQWATTPDNPTLRAQAAAARLTRQLAGRQAVLRAVTVQPRIVWAGPGLLLPEEPTVPIWHLGQVDTLLADLFGRPQLGPAEQQAALAELTAAAERPRVATAEIT